MIITGASHKRQWIFKINLEKLKYKFVRKYFNLNLNIVRNWKGYVMQFINQSEMLKYIVYSD